MCMEQAVIDTTKAGFCKSLLWHIDIRWLDKTGMVSLRNASMKTPMIARIELDTHGCYGSYPGFRVTIINPTNGKVDEKYFAFDDYLSSKMEDRRDTYTHLPHGSDICFQVVTNCNPGNAGQREVWQWYLPVPKDTRPFCQAVESYIAMFS